MELGTARTHGNHGAAIREIVWILVKNCGQLDDCEYRLTRTGEPRPTPLHLACDSRRAVRPLRCVVESGRDDSWAPRHHGAGPRSGKERRNPPGHATTPA